MHSVVSNIIENITANLQRESIHQFHNNTVAVEIYWFWDWVIMVIQRLK